MAKIEKKCYCDLLNLFLLRFEIILFDFYTIVNLLNKWPKTTVNFVATYQTLIY